MKQVKKADDTITNLGKELQKKCKRAGSRPATVQLVKNASRSNNRDITL